MQQTQQLLFDFDSAVDPSVTRVRLTCMDYRLNAPTTSSDREYVQMYVGENTVNVRFEGAANHKTIDEVVELILKLYPNIDTIEIEPHNDCGALKVVTKVLLNTDGLSEGCKDGLAKPLEQTFREAKKELGIKGDCAEGSEEFKKLREKIEKANPEVIAKAVKNALNSHHKLGMYISPALETVNPPTEADQKKTPIAILTLPSTKTAEEIVRSLDLNPELYKPYIVQVYTKEQVEAAVEVTTKLGIKKYVSNFGADYNGVAVPAIQSAFEKAGGKGLDVSIVPLENLMVQNIERPTKMKRPS